MFNAKKKIQKLLNRRLNGGNNISKASVKDFLRKNNGRTIWYKGEPFHITELTSKLEYPDNPYQNAYAVYPSPQSAINPHCVYYKDGSWSDLCMIYRNILIKIDSSNRFFIYYNPSCQWSVTDTGITGNDSKSILYVSMFGDIMEEYTAGKYDENVYEAIKFLINNEALYQK